MRPGAEIDMMESFKPGIIAPLKPGDYTLAVSVGSWQGTPEIALPLGSQLGATRRYEIGKIHLRFNEGGKGQK